MSFFKRKKVPSLLLRTAITAALIFFLFQKTDIAALAAVLRRCDPVRMALAFGLFFMLNIVIFFRWRLLLKGRCVALSLPRLFLTYMASHFFNLFLPSTVGGDTMRTLDVSQRVRQHSSGILATVILDRLTGFMGLVTVLGVVLVFGFGFLRDPGVLTAACILLAAVAVISAVMFSGRFFRAMTHLLPAHAIKDYLVKIHEAACVFKGQKEILLKAWLLSVAAHVGLCFVYLVVAQAARIPIAFVQCLILVPVVTACSVIPVSVGGLGVRDTASVVLFAKAGLSAEQALTLSLANFAFILFVGLLGGVAYVVDLYCRRV